MNNFAVNIYTQVFVWTYFSVSLGWIPRSEIAGLYDGYTFNLIRHCQTLFQRDCVIVQSHQQCMRVHSPISQTGTDRLLNFTDSSESAMIFHCGFNFPDDWSCPYWLVIYLCWAGTFSNLLPIFYCIICFLIILETSPSPVRYFAGTSS